MREKYPDGDYFFKQVRDDLETEKPRNEEVTEKPRQIEIFPSLVESFADEKTLVSTSKTKHMYVTARLR